MKSIRYSLAALIIVVVVGGTLMRSAGYFIHDIYWFQESLGGDGPTHVIMGFLLVMALWLFFPKKASLKILGWVIAFLVLEECAQLLHKYREFSLLDMQLGILGAFLGILCLVTSKRLLLWRQRSKMKKTWKQTYDSQ